MCGKDVCEMEDFELLLCVATTPTNKIRKHTKPTNASLRAIFFLILGTIQTSASFWRKLVYKEKNSLPGRL
jgi:hypothetical protein